LENFETLFRWANVDFLNLNRLKILRAVFGDLQKAWKVSPETLISSAKIPARSARNFAKRRAEFLKNEKSFFEKFEKLNAQLLFLENENYPLRLKKIPDPPIFLFSRGEISPADDLSFAVIGSRNLTAIGRRAIEKIVPDLTRSKLTIVSGLARGADIAAQKVAVNSGGRTIGVLGSGIDKIWPTENSKLADEILSKKCGAIISEFPLGTDPLAFNFPRRNRIVSGLSLGVLVIEGKEKSGSLITAQLALDQNREVFAIPGSPFSPLSRGPNNLIKRGEAKLTEDSLDILEEFSLEKIDSQSSVSRAIAPDENEKLILDFLQNEPQLFDKIATNVDLPSQKISQILTVLEMKGWVRNLGMGNWTVT
jgi:DNA processing protein